MGEEESCSKEEEKEVALGHLDTSIEYVLVYLIALVHLKVCVIPTSAFSESQQKAIHNWSQKDAEDKPFCELGGRLTYIQHFGHYIRLLTLFISSDDSDESSIYVDLLKNIEKYTGYKGESSQRVWGSIYRENCFKWVTQKSFSLLWRHFFLNAFLF